jgi:hypothetical protein
MSQFHYRGLVLTGIVSYLLGIASWNVYTTQIVQNTRVLTEQGTFGLGAVRSSEEREVNVAFPFVSPLLSCDVSLPDTTNKEISTLKSTIESYLETKRSEGNVGEAVSTFVN